MKYFIIGDIHGCYEELQDLLTKGYRKASMSASATWWIVQSAEALKFSATPNTISVRQPRTQHVVRFGDRLKRRPRRPSRVQLAGGLS
jgi:hypothetical protein